MTTHEEKHSIGISFPTFHHLLILSNSLFKIHGEKCSRTIGRVGISLRGLIFIYRGRLQCEAKRWVNYSNNCSIPKPCSMAWIFSADEAIERYADSRGEKGEEEPLYELFQYNE
jgi:hypothetical protein